MEDVSRETTQRSATPIYCSGPVAAVRTPRRMATCWVLRRTAIDNPKISAA